MLPAPHRLSRGGDIRRVIRSGHRRGGDLLVVHLLRRGVGDPGRDDPVRVGFVVGRTVGNSVVRHRVQRRLRHLCAERLASLPAGSALVVRALPSSAAASSAELGAELDRCLRQSLERGEQPSTVRGPGTVS